VAVGFALKEVPDREDGAAEVGEDDHALATVGASDRLSDGVSARPQLSVGTAARGFNSNLGAGHLRGQVCQAARKLKAMGDKYNPDQIRNSPAGWICPRDRVLDDGP
jgi:hypothetical protein